MMHWRTITSDSWSLLLVASSQVFISSIRLLGQFAAVKFASALLILFMLVAIKDFTKTDGNSSTSTSLHAEGNQHIAA
jgi:uncharacterized membrane protein